MTQETKTPKLDYLVDVDRRELQKLKLSEMARVLQRGRATTTGIGRR